MKDIILGCLVLTILSSCGVRKVAINKSITEIKETAVQTLKQSDTATVISKQVDNIIDTSKIINENKTVIELFNDSGKLVQRVTSYSKEQKHNYIAKYIAKTDSTFLSAHSELKDSSVVSIKKIDKVKQSEAYRPNFLIFGLLLVVVGISLYYFTRKSL